MAPKRTHQRPLSLLEITPTDVNTTKGNVYKVLELLGSYWRRKRRAEAAEAHGRFLLSLFVVSC